MKKNMPKNRYIEIISAIFSKYYHRGDCEIKFNRTDIIDASQKLGIELPKNLGDIVYSFRYRTVLPKTIVDEAPKGTEWIIRPAGRAKYVFVAAQICKIIPSSSLVETKIPDATPGVIEKYAFNDEQSLLAKLRYNRLIDVFTGLTCYSLQNHFRTTAPDVGQVEIDEMYIGLDKRGVHYILPVQAKGGNDKMGVVQIEQDFAVCANKFPQLMVRSIGAQFMEDDLIALFEFDQTDKGIKISSEKHYRLVQPSELSSEELANYRKRPL